MRYIAQFSLACDPISASHSTRPPRRSQPVMAGVLDKWVDRTCEDPRAQCLLCSIATALYRNVLTRLSHPHPRRSAEVVNVITNDGRNIIGLFKGFDNVLNIVLESSHERVYSPDAPMEQIPRGLCIIRGDNV